MNFRTPSGRTTRTLLLVLFFLSGACGLVYQVVWQRLLCLIFGNTTFATATVLAAFMGGLALGSFLLGGFADRTKNPLRLYAVLQFGIGVLALLMPLLLSITGAVNTILYHRLSANYPLFTLIRFLLCFGVLLLPTALMGGTLPAISKYFVKNLKGLGRSVGSLYGINTFGAVAGCLLTGFFLIAAIGVRHTTLLAALTNMAIAATAFLLSRAPSPSQATQEKPPPAKSDKHRKEGQSDRAYPRYIAPLILIIYALSGFCALTYEVLWTRALVFFFGSTTFAFTTMLATFLFGLAIGSTLFARYAGRRKHLLPLLGILEILIGLFALLSIWEFSELEGLLTRLRASLGGNWWAFTAGRFAGGFIIMLIPTVLMGAVFPLVSRIVTRSVKNLGGSIGKVYGANTLGCIFGALLAGFLIIPLVGITQGIMGTAFLNIALGGLVLSLHPSGGLKLKSGAFAVTALLIVSGAFALKDQKPITLSCGMFKDLHKGGKLLYYEEATAGTITVHSIAPSPSEHKPPKFIEVDGLDVAGTNLELQTTQKLQGHLPVLLYKSMNERSPQKCFIVAFGSGASTYETSLHPEIGHIRGVEINPSVVKAAPHFAELNHNVLENPRYHLAIDDARTFLMHTREQYDVIADESVHPRLNVDLYSRDFFRICKSKLSPDGVVSCWLPLYSLQEEGLKTILKTFLSVFPHASLWYGSNCINRSALLIGTLKPLRLSLAPIKEAFANEAIANSLREIHIHSAEDLLSYFITDESRLTAYSEEGRLITSDRPTLAYTRRMEYLDPQDIRTLNALRTNVLSLFRHERDKQELEPALTRVHQATGHVIEAIALSFGKQWEASMEQLRRALSINPGHPSTIRMLNRNRCVVLTWQGWGHFQKGQYERAIEKFKTSLELIPSPLDHSNLGISYVQLREYDKAIPHLIQALRVWPNSPQTSSALRRASAAKRALKARR